ncbi:aminotransferase class IV [Bdellovibrio sp. HCB337]|uniref:aminotransferase class IV n=1 Tax=Bdellovibrio sp. HCB337 TaxID=3394358 RepID=UPI0039A4A82D
MSIPLLSSEEILKKLSLYSYEQKQTYFAMYSSWYGGITKDPSLMLVPIDDHLVHRGDGVFEAMKYVHGKVYLMNDHLDRLESSSKQIGIEWPMSRTQMVEMIHQVIKVSQAKDAIIRLYMSRGPGGFTTNPYESVGTQVYCVVTQLKPMSEQKYQDGAKIGKSLITPKEPWFATIKSCNYLPNVLMKKEAVDRKLDFTIGFDSHGYITEGSTENIIFVNAHNELVRPPLKQILRGTTMMRALHLAEDLVHQKQLAAVTEKMIHEKDLLKAKEVMMVGTTLDVLPVTEYEGHKIGDGKAGFISQSLRRLIVEDMK